MKLGTRELAKLAGARALAVLAFLLVGFCLRADTKSAETPIALVPYKITVWLDFAAHPRFTPTVSTCFRQEFSNLAEWSMGAAWQLSFVPAPENIAIDVHALPHRDVMKPLTGDADKIIWLRIADGASAGIREDLLITTCEYDVQFETWGAPGRKAIESSASLPRSAFELVHRQFRPTLQVFGRDKVNVMQILVGVQGLALQPKDSSFPLVRKGTPFRMYRDIYSKGKKTDRKELAWTYLHFESYIEPGVTAYCRLMSSLGDPISKSTRFRHVGIAANASADGISVLEFVTSGRDSKPVEGFEVAVLPVVPNAIAVRVGNTDRRGRVTISPQLTDAGRQQKEGQAQLLQVFLRLGKIVLATFPLVPGDRSDMRIPVTIDPLLTEINGRILALQEEMVDTVAQRAILQRKLEALQERFNAEEDKKKQADIFKQLEQTNTQLNALPDKPAYEERLEKIKEFVKNRLKQKGVEKEGRSIVALYKQTETLLNDHFAKGKSILQTDTTMEGEEGKSKGAPATKGDEKKQ